MTKFGLNLRHALLGAVAAGAFGLAASSASAGAISQVAGPFEIKYNGVTTEDWKGGTIGSTTITNGNESTFGIGEITTIQNTNNGSFLFVDNLIPTGQRIFFVLYGIADAQINGSGPVDIYNVGCTGGSCDGKIHVDFYAVPNATPDVRNLADTNRTGFSTFTGITDTGTKIMQWVLEPGAHADLGDGGFDESTASLFQTVSSSSLPATGGGNFFASCVLFGGPNDQCGIPRRAFRSTLWARPVQPSWLHWHR